MSFATTIPLLLGLAIWWTPALVIYLAVLLIKALRKYLKSGPVRQGEGGIWPGAWEAIRYHRTRCKMTQEFVAESLGCEPSGGEQVGERHRRSQHLQPAGPGQALRSFGGGAAEKRGMTPKSAIACPGRGQAIFFIGLIKRRSGRSVPAASPC